MGAAHRRARTTTALMSVVAAALVCAACGSDPGEPAPDTTNAAASTRASTTPSLDPPPPDDRPTVDRPGPLDQPLAGDDILITSPDTLPDRLVQRIEGIKVDGKEAVDDAEQFSLGQFSEESNVLDVAAVDPSTFRRFTGPTDSRFKDEWDRVANGEVALVNTLQDRVPLKDGYLDIPTEGGMQPIHVGAWAGYQVGAIDALVNSAWAPRLGLPEDNALLLYTGTTSPETVRTRIEKFAPDLSITMLDIVAQTGIDPNTFQNVSYVGPLSEAIGDYRYTPIGDGRVAPDPAWVRSHIVTEPVPILGPVTCNKYMIPQLKAALAEIQKAGLADKVYHYDGCFVPRFIAGTNTLSNHAFGMAIDINAAANQRGTVGQMDRGVVAIFKKWGFEWGGDWDYTDPMHFQVERLVKPG